MNRTEIRHLYIYKVEELQSQIVARGMKNRAFVGGEILSFLSAVGFVVLYTVVDAAAWMLWMAPVAMLVYFVIRYFYVKNDRFIEELSALKAVYENEVKYMDGDFSCFGSGEEYVDTKHPFTLDLDIFGRDSLFQRINRTVTTGGSDALAQRLSSVEWGENSVKTQKELAGMPLWRAEFMATVKGIRIDTNSIRRAIGNVREMNITSLAMKPWLLAVAILAVSGFWMIAMAAVFGKVDAALPVWWAVLQFFVVFLFCSKNLRDISRAVDCLHRQLAPYTQLIDRICTAGLTETVNKGIVDSLDEAGRSFDELGKILKAIDRRGNVLGLIISNAFFLADFLTVRRFLRWQGRCLGCVDGWLDSVSRMDALVSMATFRYNEPSAVDAQVTDDDGVVFRARGLRHPFLGDKAVGNGFDIADTHYYIITGANMAGKSTFLRAVGVNYVLAMNGMPVFADALCVSRFSLFTSMRTTDDLANGISYFYAELLRLSALLEYCRCQRHTLVILDEILKGTNSLDKLNGSRLFLQYVSEMPVTGIIATHDLELSKMAEEQKGRFHCYCFEIELGADVTYSYMMSPGVARNQNATYLLRNKVLKW